MSTLHEDIVKLYAQADAGAELKDVVEGICQALKAHAGELQNVTYSYRLHATDTGYWKRKRILLADRGRFKLCLQSFSKA